jgi:hypothetical protein
LVFFKNFFFLFFVETREKEEDNKVKSEKKGKKEVALIGNNERIGSEKSGLMPTHACSDF